MLQIKTIRRRLDNAEDFDQLVNEALAEGWVMTKRKVLMPWAQSERATSYTMLYAELERDIVTEAERCCENCAHYETDPNKPPCCDCSETASKWEPADGVIT